MISKEDFCYQAAKDNETNFVIVKAIEELSELSSALAQYLVKPISDRKEAQIKSIISEMAHVSIQLETIRYILNITKDDIRKEENIKITDLIRYKENLGHEFGKIRR